VYLGAAAAPWFERREWIMKMRIVDREAGTRAEYRRAKDGMFSEIRGQGALSLACVALGLSLGCGGKGIAPGPEPVEECRQYETALNACFHRDVSVANQASLLPKSDADRRRIKALCSENLKRIQIACR
jgi:hypothetical protein